MADIASVTALLQAALAEAQAVVTLPTGSPMVALRLTDAAAIARAAGQSSVTQAINIAQPWAFVPEFGVEPTGMPYMRMSSDPDTTHANRQRLIDWRLPFAASDEVYTRYLLFIESDVQIGMTETGVKLPGAANTFSANQTELCEVRTEHGKNDPANPGTYPFKSHWYIAETPPGGTAIVAPLGANLTAGRWFCIEAHNKLNTPGVADGVLEIKLNGALVHRRTNVLYRNSANTKFSWFYVNVYHGGLGNPSTPIHYRIAEIMVAAYWPGVPAQMPVDPPPVDPPPGSFPTWRAAMTTRDVFSSIANTSNMGGLTGNVGTVNSWNGFAAAPSAWYAALCGGHADSLENKVLALDLSANIPAWALKDAGSPAAGSPDASYYPDGRPASRHTYYTSHYIAARNRVMLFTAAALWGTGGAQTGKVDGFNLATNTWDAAGTFSDCPIFSTANVVAVDPATGNVYVGATSNRFAKWTQATATWSTISPISGSGSWEFKGAMVDGTRNRLVTMNSNLRFINLATLAVTNLTVTGPLAGASTNYWSIVHDLDNDRYIVVNGTGVYAINPTTGVSTLLTTVTTATNGVNNRLAYFQALGGIAYLPNFASNVQFMPTRLTV